jgi:hypothetical protein
MARDRESFANAAVSSRRKERCEARTTVAAPKVTTADKVRDMRVLDAAVQTHSKQSTMPHTGIYCPYPGVTLISGHAL